MAIVAFVGKQFFVMTYTVRFARGSTEKMSKRTTVVLVCLVKYGAKRSALLICPEGKLWWLFVLCRSGFFLGLAYRARS